jgi:hypothetical protein
VRKGNRDGERVMRTVVRELHVDEQKALQCMADYLEGRTAAIPTAARRRLRIFFQDHPVKDLRVSEERE